MALLGSIFPPEFWLLIGLRTSTLQRESKAGISIVNRLWNLQLYLPVLKSFKRLFVVEYKVINEWCPALCSSATALNLLYSQLCLLYLPAVPFMDRIANFSNEMGLRGRLHVAGSAIFIERSKHLMKVLQFELLPKNSVLRHLPCTTAMSVKKRVRSGEICL